MKKNLLLRLCLMTTVMLSLYSCIHDEVYSSYDPSSTEYTNKSLWKQDEKYIKNVMKVYTENEANIKKVNGIPYWNFATTVDSFDESFVAIPVVDNGKVTSVLKVPRHSKKIYFYYTQDESDLAFFQALVFAKHKKAVMPDGSTAQTDGISCTRQWISVWFPDNESNPDPDTGSGHWESTSIIKCKQLSDDCLGFINEYGQCDGGNGDGGYDYPGGGGGEGTEPEEEENNPCEKMQTQNNAEFQNKINNLKSKLTLKKETGYIENDNGNFTYRDNASATEDANTLSLPDPDYYKDIKGYMHTHPNNFEDANGNMRIGFKIFSPADIIYFNELVRNAKENGLPLDNVYAVMVSGTGTYQIRFTGNVNQIKTTYTNTGEQYNEMYKKYFLANPKISDELNFLKFMDQQMYVKGVSLVKMNNDGTFTTKTLNTDKTEVANSECP